MKIDLTEKEIEWIMELIAEDFGRFNDDEWEKDPIYIKLEEGLKRIKGIDW